MLTIPFEADLRIEVEVANENVISKLVMWL